jgi:hypothetical protein
VVEVRKPEHTPTPWAYDSNGIITIHKVPRYHDPDRPADHPRFKGECPNTVNEVCVITPQFNYYTRKYRSDEAKANAEFIVRACNAHEKLVEALRLAGPMGTLAAKLSVLVLGAYQRDNDAAMRAFGSNAGGHVANDLARSLIAFKAAYQEALALAEGEGGEQSRG